MKVSLYEQFLATENKSGEPALKVGISTASVAGILSLINFFMPDLLDEKATTFVLVVVAFLLPIINAILTRPKVWSPASVEQVIEEAVEGATAEQMKAKKPNTPPAPKLL